MAFATWHKLKDFITQGFVIQDAHPEEAQEVYNYDTDLSSQHWFGYIMGIASWKSFQSFIQNLKYEYSKELEELLLLDKKQISRVLSPRNDFIQDHLSKLLVLNSSFPKGPFSKIGQEDRYDGKIMIKVDVYANSKKKAIAEAYSEYSNFLNWILEAHQKILIQFDLLPSGLLDFFKYEGGYSLKDPYRLLTNHGYLDQQQCPFTNFDNIFIKGSRGYKANWLKSQASFKYFINQITGKGGKISGHRKWVKASNCFTFNGNVRNHKSISYFRSSLPKTKEKAILDKIAKLFNR